MFLDSSSERSVFSKENFSWTSQRNGTARKPYSIREPINI